MTEIKMIVECSLGQKVEQTLKNEKDFDNIEIQNDIDNYIHEYIIVFNKNNSEIKRYVKSIKMYYDGQEIRNINKE